jgi:3-oxoadipate enol-lactonase
MEQNTIRLKTRRGEFRVAVDGDAAAPALVLGNSLGTTLEMWEPQVAAFAGRFRLIRYDTRGHGGSPATPGPYSFDDLGQDVLAVLDALDVERAAFCGISMGGHTGLWLGIHAGRRFNAIAVCNSAARIGTEQAWRERAAMVRAGGAAGMRALADSAPGRWFTEGFAQTHPAVVQRAQGWIAGIDPEGYAACAAASAGSPRPRCCWPARWTPSPPWPMPRPCRRASPARDWPWCPRPISRTSKRRRPSTKPCWISWPAPDHLKENPCCIWST